MTLLPPRQDLEKFRVEVHPERDRVRVVPVGELDLATVEDVDARLHELRGAGFACIVLDLRQLAFLDSTGIRLILAHSDLAHLDGYEFALIGGSAPIQRALKICGLLDRLPFHPG